MAGFLAGAFLATVFLAAGLVALLAAGFVAGLVATVLVAVFLVDTSLTPASLAIFDRFDLRLAAVFLLIRFFFTAISISPCAFDRAAALGFAINALTALLISRLIPTFFSRRFVACFARFIADLIIGMSFLYLLNELYNQGVIIRQNN